MKSAFSIIYISIFIVFKFNAAILPPGYAEELIIDNIDPTRMAIMPDGAILLAQKNGIISMIRDGILLDDPFLKIPVDNYNERGLTGLVLDPDFESNNYYYVYYTILNDNKNRVSRFTANGDFTVPGSEKIILELDELGGTIHNGGDMAFANDGSLFIAIGDGSFGHTPQNPESLFGKILRINPDGSIPFDNPYYEEYEGIYRSIYALGLRNPFTIDYDKINNRLFANDVGNADWEELIHVESGMNYGWPIIEGPFISGSKPDNYRDALLNYPHSEGYCAIVGAAFYNPASSLFEDKYLGKYFFGDYCVGNIRVFNPVTEQIEEEFASGIDRPISIKVAPNGDIYYLARGGIGGGSEEDNTASSNGKLYRIYYAGEGTPFIVSQPKDLLVPIGEDANFSITAGGIGQLSYKWNANGTHQPEDTLSQFVIEDVDLMDHNSRVFCEVFIDSIELVSDTVSLSVTSNTRPQISILRPGNDQSYSAGDTIYFEGLAYDDEDGELSQNNLNWKIDFHHDDHTHPMLSDYIGAEGFIVIPKSGEISTNVWVRCYLTAFDSEGLAGSDYVDVFPLQSSFEASTIPEGLKLSIDGKLQTTPSLTYSVIGLNRTISAPVFQELNSTAYVFEKWSDGALNSIRSFEKGQNQESFVAIYQEAENLEGTGLLGVYQEYDISTDQLMGDPFFRIDSIVNFDWGENAPIPDIIATDKFKVIWRGRLTPLIDQNYRLYVSMDDGAKLYIDNQLVVDAWENGPRRERSASIFLEGSHSYPIRMEYYEDGGGASAQLSWSSPLLTKQTIPKINLTPDPIPGFADVAFSPEVRHNNESLIFIINSEQAMDLDWNINDSTGKKVIEGTANIIPGENEINLEYLNLYPGFYVWNLESFTGEKASTSFIKN